MLPQAIRREVISKTVEIVAGRVPVLAGVMDCSVANVLERLEEAAGLGAIAGVSTLPFYGWTDYPAGAVVFFETLADKSPIPVVPYNLPMRVKITMQPDTIRALYGHPNIPGIKDTNTDQAEMEAIAGDPDRPASFKYLAGNTGLAAHLMAAGADGFVPSPANVMPGACVAIYDQHRAGNPKVAAAIGQCMAKLNDINKRPSTSGGLKIALEIKGICSRYTMRPWPQADDADEQAVREILAEVERMYAPFNSGSA